jgi:hypothetical protein
MVSNRRNLVRSRWTWFGLFVALVLLVAWRAKHMVLLTAVPTEVVVIAGSGELRIKTSPIEPLPFAALDGAPSVPKWVPISTLHKNGTTSPGISRDIKWDARSFRLPVSVNYSRLFGYTIATRLAKTDEQVSQIVFPHIIPVNYGHQGGFRREIQWDPASPSKQR